MAAVTKVDVLLPLANTPEWASARPTETSAYRPGNAAEPALLAHWETYVRTVGERYRGKIRHYEIWNEPSDSTHFTGDVQTLVTLTCSAFRILKNVDPDIKLVSPASAGGGRHVNYLDRFLAAGGNKCIDIVGHHLYVYQHGPEAMIPIIREIRAVMKRNGVAHLPLWNTETGWWLANGDSAPEHPLVAKGGWKKYAGKQSEALPLRAFLIALSEGVSRFYWYAWDNKAGLGMIEGVSNAEKPVVEGWRSATAVLLGTKHVKCDVTPLNSICRVRNQDDTVTEYRWSN